MDDPQFGVRIEKLDAFESLADDWAFQTSIDWETVDYDAYPREKYAYLYGFKYAREEDQHLDGAYDSFYVANFSKGSEGFTNLWYTVASTCEPFSVLYSTESNHFPTVAELAFGRSEPYVYRIDGQPGELELVNVPLDGSDEEVEDTWTWDVDAFLGERVTTE